jgi:hypothetical protein
MSPYVSKSPTELREKAAHVRDLARLNIHQTVIAANLRSYADDLDAEAARIEAEQPRPGD